MTDLDSVGRNKRFSVFWLIAFTAGIGLIMFVAGSVAAAFYLTSEARRPIGAFDGYLPPSTENVQFTTSDHLTLRGWLAIPDGAKKAVVLLHGRGSTRHQMLARAGLLFQHGYAVLLYDARAHGESEGTRSSAGWHEVNDLFAAMDLLRNRRFPECGCIGVSQGGATIALAAPRLRGIRWVVLESVYPSMRQALDHRFRRVCRMPAWLAGCLFIPAAEFRLGVKIDDLAPSKSISSFHCPVWIAGGDSDIETPPDETRALFAAANEPKQLWMVPGAAHVDLYGFAKENYAKRLLNFIAQAEEKRSSF